MSHDVDAIYDHGLLRPLEPLALPEGARVRLHIEEKRATGEAKPEGGRIPSPRLVHPEQAAEFEMEVREIGDGRV